MCPHVQILMIFYLKISHKINKLVQELEVIKL